MRSIGLLLKVLWSPGEAMFLLSKNPRVLAPMIFLCLFSGLTGSVVLTKLDSAELAMRTIERSFGRSNLSDEQKAEIRERIKSQVNSPIAKGLSFASTFIGPVFVVLFVTLIYFGLFTMLGREGSFKAFLSVTAFACVPMIFRQMASVLRAWVVPASVIMPDELGSLSPAVFLDRDSVSPVVFAAVNSMDLVSIWTLILLVIGYGFMTRKNLSKAARASAVVGVFLVYVALRLAAAALRGI